MKILTACHASLLMLFITSHSSRAVNTCCHNTCKSFDYELSVSSLKTSMAQRARCCFLLYMHNPHIIYSIKLSIASFITADEMCVSITLKLTAHSSSFFPSNFSHLLCAYQNWSWYIRCMRCHNSLELETFLRVHTLNTSKIYARINAYK